MSQNPFEITKAVDYTDNEIIDTFVDYPTGGYSTFAAPASPVAKFLVGGKGGGRTHLMRYYSYSLRKSQLERYIDAVKRDKYIGVYFRCSGLNASRFSGKRISDDAWTTAFNFYMDVWLTEYLLNTLADMSAHDCIWNAKQQTAFVRAALEPLNAAEDVLSGKSALSDELSIESFRAGLAAFRKRMDRSINNAAINGTLDVQILSNPGVLLFSTTSAAHQELIGLQDVLFTFLIDEFENLDVTQQIYINTLIREKDRSTSFMIGSRQWGVRTQKTFSAGEENKRGSEYEWVELEQKYRAAKDSYSEFCIKLTTARLAQAGFGDLGPDRLKKLFAKLPETAGDRFGDTAALAVLGSAEHISRPHLRTFHKGILRWSDNAALADNMIEIVSRPRSPISEKLALLRIYQQWSSSMTIDEAAARTIAEEVDALRDGHGSRALVTVLNLWKNDIIAQLYVENNRRPPYIGLDRFIDMSGYLPRSYLTTLKYIVQAALVRGQVLFSSEEPISVDAQSAGVLEASEWFVRDAKPTGRLGQDCSLAITRLGTLFNRVRYSEKPPEVGVVAFTTDLQGIGEEVLDVISVCKSHGLLIEIPSGRKARNQGSILRKFQLHPMIAPKFALPIGRRGELKLNSDEINAVFDPSISEEQYATLVRRRIAPLTLPFGSEPSVMSKPSQGGLF